MLRPRTIAELRAAGYTEHSIRSVKDEVRENIMARLQKRETVFPEIIGFESTVIPQLVNAILSRHNFILLGLRGQAKSRILRELTGLLDEATPAIDGCEINDNPFNPICKQCRIRVAEMGDETPVAFLSREQRYIEKLATPDVTIADLLGDIDPIRAVRGGHLLSDELTIHYGLLPRANRGIFAVNELPDLAPRVQVGLFNIMQEGDVQIKGYPVRMPLDVLLVFSANPEDYTARGKIITPLKDRMGSEIATHYPVRVEDGMEISSREAWVRRNGQPVVIPEFIARAVEQIAFEARQDSRVDRRSGVSQRLPITLLENVVSNAERRRLLANEPVAVPRISDIYAALPAITGKLELEYEGEQRGAAAIARELIRAGVGRTFDVYAGHLDHEPVVEWFENGGSIRVSDEYSSSVALAILGEVEGLLDSVTAAGLAVDSEPGLAVAACELILEGLYARKKIGRGEEHEYTAAPREARTTGFENLARSRRIN